LISFEIEIFISEDDDSQQTIHHQLPVELIAHALTTLSYFVALI